MKSATTHTLPLPTIKMKSVQIFLLLFYCSFSFSQTNIYALRDSEHQGYKIIDANGELLFEMNRYCEPIYDGVKQTGSYPDLIIIPTNSGVFPIRYLENFYLANTSGIITSVLDKHTEWVHPFVNGLSRVSLYDRSKKVFSDMFITVNGDNPFKQKFKDASDFNKNYAVVEYFDTNDWHLINSKGESVLNITKNFSNSINNVINYQEGIWRINFTGGKESEYFNRNGTFTKDPKTLPEYFSSLIFLDEELLNRLKKEAPYRLSQEFHPNDHLVISEKDTITNKSHLQLYSIKNERKHLKNGNNEVLSLDRIYKDFIISHDDSNFYVFKRDNLQLVFKIPDRPSVVDDKVTLTKNYKAESHKKHRAFNTAGLDITPYLNKAYSTSRTSKFINKDVKVLHLISPTNDTLRHLKNYPNLECLIIQKYKGDSLFFNDIEKLEKLEKLVFIECRELTSKSLNQFTNKIKFLELIRCTSLCSFPPSKKDPKFQPDSNKWQNLHLIRRGYMRFQTDKNEIKKVGNTVYSK